MNLYVDLFLAALGRIMVDLDDRKDGFYWISIDGQQAEVAQWQAEWSQWLVAGSGRPLPDDLAARLMVLSDTLPPPVVPAVDPEQDANAAGSLSRGVAAARRLAVYSPSPDTNGGA